MYHWNLLAVAIKLINSILIPRINQAITETKKGKGQQRVEVPQEAPPEEGELE
jgi:hypothetical protein